MNPRKSFWHQFRDFVVGIVVFSIELLFLLTFANGFFSYFHVALGVDQFQAYVQKFEILLPFLILFFASITIVFFCLTRKFNQDSQEEIYSSTNEGLRESDTTLERGNDQSDINSRDMGNNSRVQTTRRRKVRGDTTIGLILMSPFNFYEFLKEVFNSPKQRKYFLLDIFTSVLFIAASLEVFILKTSLAKVFRQIIATLPSIEGKLTVTALVLLMVAIPSIVLFIGLSFSLVSLLLKQIFGEFRRKVYLLKLRLIHIPIGMKILSVAIGSFIIAISLTLIFTIVVSNKPQSVVGIQANTTSTPTIALSSTPSLSTPTPITPSPTIPPPATFTPSPPTGTCTNTSNVKTYDLKKDFDMCLSANPLSVQKGGNFAVKAYTYNAHSYIPIQGIQCVLSVLGKQIEVTTDANGNAQWLDIQVPSDSANSISIQVDAAYSDTTHHATLDKTISVYP